MISICAEIKALYKNIKARGFKDITSKKRVSMYLDAKKHSVTGITIPVDEVFSYAEQLLHRRDTCRPCYNTNECVDCKCKAREVMAEPKGYCSDKQWFEMLSPAEWDKYKEERKLVIGVK